MNFVQTGLVLFDFKIHIVFDGEKVNLPSYCCIGHIPHKRGYNPQKPTTTATPKEG